MPRRSRSWSGWPANTRFTRTGGHCSRWPCTAVAGKAMRWTPYDGRARSSPRSWVPTRGLVCARWSMPCSSRTPISTSVNGATRPRVRRGPTGHAPRVGSSAALVEALVRRRLLALDGDHLEVAHEALLTAWPRLERWLDDDAAGRAVRRHVAPAAQEWQSHGRPVEELYRGARLDAAAEWASQPESDVTPLEREFIGAGVDQG